ncbi:MAG: cupin domain-containing protein [Elusimicrobia bacterium]|nr:cupin domain-containing protein [Elusimicrobiota bacterium]
MLRIKIEKATDELLEQLRTETWNMWSCEPSEFQWEYPEEEICHILEGRAEITTPDCTVEIRQGDIVTFPKGLKCAWKVYEPIHKVYAFRGNL